MQFRYVDLFGLIAIICLIIMTLALGHLAWGW